MTMRTWLLLAGTTLLACQLTPTAVPPCLAQATELAELPAVNVRNIITEAPAAKEHPDTDAIVLFQRITYRIDAEGRVSRRVHQLQKLFTEWACRNLSDLRPGWDASHQELIVHTCRTFMRDGKVVDTPPNGFNEVTPDAVVRCPDFLTYREMVISHVGVELDCILELDYEIRDTSPAALPASGLEFLQGELPIRTKQVVVTAPRDIFLTWQGVNGDLADPMLIQEDNNQTVLWVVRNQPALPFEGNQMHQGDYLPHVMFSTIPDPSTLSLHLKKLTEAAASSGNALQDWLLDPDSESDPDASLTTLDRVERIAALLGDRTRTVRTVDRGWGRPPRAATQVFATSYGTAWEKAILGLTLLRELGLSPELAFFSRWNTFTEAVATQLNFEEMRLVVPVDGENYWLSPSSSQVVPSRCELVGKTGFFLDDSPKKYRTYLVPPFGSQCQLVVKVQPSPEGGFQAQCDLDLQGQFWFPERKKSVEDIATKLATSLLQDGEVTSTETRLQTPVRLQLRMTANGPALADATDDLVNLALPTAGKTLADLMPGGFRPSQLQRQTPLFVSEELSENLDLTLVLPQDWQVAFTPDPVEETGEHASFRLATEIDGQVVHLTRDLRITGGVIAPAAYPGLQEVMAKAAAPARQQVILQIP